MEKDRSVVVDTSSFWFSMARTDDEVNLIAREKWESMLAIVYGTTAGSVWIATVEKGQSLPLER